MAERRQILLRIGWRILFITGGVAVLLLAFRFGPSVPETMARGEDTPELLFPDLRTLPPRDIEIVLSRPGPNGERRLRFDNRIWNAGGGPVEAFPVTADCDGDGNTRNDRLAIQRIYRDKHDSDIFERDLDTDFDTHEVGCMEFHARHNHWHIKDFAKYELWRLEDLGVAGSQPVATSTKVSFCMIDTFAHDLTLPGAPAGSHYRTCARDAVYGISIGWGDEYQSSLADQWIVINGVPDGDFCLVSTANPIRRFVESNYDNNAAGVKIKITGNTVTPRDPTLACGP
jgi:hypothetical protein